MKTIRVDEWFHEYIKAEKQDGETMAEALIRLTGAPAPDPEFVAGIIGEETSEAMLSTISEQSTASHDEVIRMMDNDS